MGKGPEGFEYKLADLKADQAMWDTIDTRMATVGDTMPKMTLSAEGCGFLHNTIKDRYDTIHGALTSLTSQGKTETAKIAPRLQQVVTYYTDFENESAAEFKRLHPTFPTDF